jgi:hypothetical protein
VSLAARVAQDEINKFIRGLANVSWATLRAAVRRGGVFDGARRIDFPVQFSVRFEEPVAAVWARDVLAPLRAETRELANAYAGIAASMIDAAKPDVAPAILDLARLEHQVMVAQVETFSAIGNDKIDVLRATVRAELISRVEGPVRARCEAFVNRGEDVGKGVKQRLLGLCEELVPEVMKAAEAVAREILETNFKTAETDIQTALEGFPDPVERITAALVSSREAQTPIAQAARNAVRQAIAEALIADPGPVIGAATRVAA